jgi:putative ABC transport system permease protein
VSGRGGLLLRGMRWRLGASVLIVLTATIAVATAVLGPLYLHTAGDSVLRRTVDSAPVQERGVTVLPASDQANPLAPVQRAEQVVRRAGGGRRWYGSPITTVTSGVLLPAGKSQLFWRTGICRVLHFVKGGCVLGPGDVVMTARGARQARVSVGGTLAARVTGATSPLQLKVTGIVSVPDLNLPYWWGDGPEDFPLGLSLGAPGNPAENDPLIASPATALNVPSQDVPTAIGQIPLRPGAVSLADERDVERVLRSTTVELSGQGIRAGSQLRSLLADADRQRHAMSTIVAIAAIQLVLLAVWVLGSVLLRSSDARRSEARVARLRGFPASSMMWVTAAEPGLLCLTGAILGVVVAWLSMVVARGQLFVPSAVIAFDGWTFLALALTLAAIVGALGIGTVRLLRLADPARDGAATTRDASSASRIVDVVLVVLAIVALVALGTTGALNGHTDPLASAAPGLIALGTAVLAVQLILMLCRLGIPVTADSAWVGSFLALRQSVRRPRVLRQARVLIIALCLACFAAAAWSVARNNRATAAQFQVGANTVVAVAPRSAGTLEAAVRRVDPRGRFAMAAVQLRTPSTTLLAVDAPRLPAVASWPRGVSAHGLASVSRTLDPPSVPAVQLPNAPLRVTATTTATAKLLHADLGAWVFGTSGTAIVDLGALRAGEQTYRGGLGGVCSGGCELAGLGVIPPGDGGGRAAGGGTVTVRVGRIWSELPGGASRTASADLVAGGWRASGAGVSVESDPANGLTITATPAAIASDGGAAGGFTPPMASPADHPRLVPVLATSQLEALNAGGVGPMPTQGLDGNNISVQPAASASALPSVGADALMVDLNLLTNLQAGPTSPDANDQVWLGPQAPADVLSRLRSAGLQPLTVQRSSAVFQQLERSGPALADDFLLVATIAALLVATASTLGALGATTRERATELSSLEVAGVPRPALVRSLGLESAILILSALCGAGAGALAAAMAIPSLPELASASFAPVHYGLPAGVIAAVALAVAVAVGLAAAGVAGVLLHRMSPSLLRTVPDDVSG